MSSSTSNLVVTLILASPARFYFVEHTYRHLKERGFSNIFWLRTPSGEELDKFDVDASKRCMMFWHSTISPCLQALHEEEGTCETLVDDTFICKAAVSFDTIYQETHNKGSGVFGNGGYQRITNGIITWHGSKGSYLMQSEWADMAVVLENTIAADHLVRFYG